LRRRLNRSLGGAAEGARPFGDLVRILFDNIGDLVEQFMDRDEGRAAYVPMRLLDLRVQVDGGGKVAVEQCYRARADLLGQGVGCTVH